uniref:Uncharacterized protein n=1 Tax=Geospiza parvula TaxID=87175 RepID=A0A8U8C6A1_GEOPR
MPIAIFQGNQLPFSKVPIAIFSSKVPIAHFQGTNCHFPGHQLPFSRVPIALFQGPNCHFLLQAKHTEQHEGRLYNIPLEEVKAVFPHGLPHRFQQQVFQPGGMHSVYTLLIAQERQTKCSLE